MPDEAPTPDEAAEPEAEPGQDGASAEPVADSAPITETVPEVTPTLDAPVSESAPLVAPVNVRPSKAPQPGDSAAAPQAVSRTAPGPHLRLVDDDGNDVDPDDVFHPQQGPATVVTVKRRVYQEYRYPGTDTPIRQLLYNAGVQVPIRMAAQAMAEIKRVEAETAARSGPEQAAAH